ncbi:MAG TPA: Fic family protein [Flavitalea sp.]|nr:Fic family protein [Flavitalea sp.]
MKKETIKTEVINFLTNHRDGKSIEVIRQALSQPIDKRTLQRRLKELIESGVIMSSGKARATVYNLANMPREMSVINSTIKKHSLIPLSKAGQEVQYLVSLPLQKREPVGYQRSFLESYNPNVSCYLTADERKRLATIGATAQINSPAGTYAKQILQRLLIDLAWNSSRLEGNTYSLLETQLLLDKGRYSDDKSAAEAQMILNHKDAIEFIVDNSGDIGFNRYSILSLHALLSNNLLVNPAASGRLRLYGVGIGGSAYSPPSVPQFIEEMFGLMLHKADQINDPFEQAFFIMVHLPYLQPFDDVNKRVSRLAANISFNKKNLAPLSFIEVPIETYIDGLLGIYELNRIDLLKDVFLWAYDRSAKQYAVQRQSLGEPDLFRLKYRDMIKQLIAEIIQNAHDKHLAGIIIKAKALEIPSEDSERFIQTVEQELINLHEGNFARYFVTPSEFGKWQKAWNE